jgi:hypothetical protein
VRVIDNDTYEAEIASAGVCGGFVINSAIGSVRLPTLVNGTLWGADASSIGQSLAAGLPNITGQFEAAGVAATTTAKGAFTQVSHGNLAFHSGGNAMGGRTFTFDASGSSSIYGNSDTVQPPAIRVSWCIQVFNAATALSEQESAQLSVLMQTKAQTDLANVNSNIDFIVEHWEDANGNWYDLYRSGKLVQGGFLPAKQSTSYIHTLNKEFANTNYQCFLNCSINKQSDMGWGYVFAKTENTFTSVIPNGEIPVSWFAIGKAATE